MAFPVTSRTTGELITAAIWNADVKDNLNALNGKLGDPVVPTTLGLPPLKSTWTRAGQTTLASATIEYHYTLGSSKVAVAQRAVFTNLSSTRYQVVLYVVPNGQSAGTQIPVYAYVEANSTLIVEGPFFLATAGDRLATYTTAPVSTMVFRVDIAEIASVDLVAGVTFKTTQAIRANPSATWVTVYQVPGAGVSRALVVAYGVANWDGAAQQMRMTMGATTSGGSGYNIFRETLSSSEALAFGGPVVLQVGDYVQVYAASANNAAGWVSVIEVA